MRRRLKKITESVKAKYNKLKETIRSCLTNEKNLENPSDLENEKIEEKVNCQKKRNWLSIFPPRVKKWVIIVGTALVIARARPNLGSASLKSLPPFERLVAVKPVEGFPTPNIPSRKSTSRDANKPKFDFLNPKPRKSYEYQKSTNLDPVIHRQRKLEAIV